MAIENVLVSRVDEEEEEHPVPGVRCIVYNGWWNRSRRDVVGVSVVVVPVTW